MTEHAREHLPPLEEMPAAHLAGLELPNGWVVRDIVLRGPAATGGFHSIPYTVVNGSGEEAFLKALNFHEALRRPGPLVNHIKEATDAFVFERDLLEGCRNDRLSRIIRLLDHGEIEVPGGGALARVPYLILELADGDIRKFQAALRQFDIAWVLRTLKHVTLGIEQLHSRHTTHQDLKPSNILTQQSGREMKLGDLGRAERRGVSGPFSSLPIPGALAYAPPEQLYGAFDHSWEMRRASDIYHLGSLAVQLFTGHCLTALVQEAMPPEMRANSWDGEFNDALPALHAGFASVLDVLQDEIGKHATDSRMVEELVGAVREMANPDPSLRGHPRDRAALTSSYSVRRYVSLFNRLAEEAEILFLGKS